MDILLHFSVGNVRYLRFKLNSGVIQSPCSREDRATLRSDLSACERPSTEQRVVYTTLCSSSFALSMVEEAINSFFNEANNNKLSR